MSDVESSVLEDRIADPTCKMIVAEICRAYPSCKGDYRLLDYRYLRFMGVNITLRDFDQLRSIWSLETVNRRYRELQDEDPEAYSPSEETLLKRGKNERVYRRFYRESRQNKTMPLGAFL